MTAKDNVAYSNFGLVFLVFFLSQTGLESD